MYDINDPREMPQIKFLQVIEGQGSLGAYLTQQVAKTYPPDEPWAPYQFQPYFEERFNAAYLKFQADKARYLETGELPDA